MMTVQHNGRTYSLEDLAHYLRPELRELLHSTDLYDELSGELIAPTDLRWCAGDAGGRAPRDNWLSLEEADEILRAGPYPSDASLWALADDAGEPRFVPVREASAQEWWDEYARRYPQDAAHALACAPVTGLR